MLIGNPLSRTCISPLRVSDAGYVGQQRFHQISLITPAIPTWLQTQSKRVVIKSSYISQDWELTDLMVARQQPEKLICRSDQRIHGTCIRSSLLTTHSQHVSPLFCLSAPLRNQVVIYRSKTQNIYRLLYYHKALLVPLYAPVWPSQTAGATLQDVQAIPVKRQKVHVIRKAIHHEL